MAVAGQTWPAAARWEICQFSKNRFEWPRQAINALPRHDAQIRHKPLISKRVGDDDDITCTVEFNAGDEAFDSDWSDHMREFSLLYPFFIFPFFSFIFLLLLFELFLFWCVVPTYIEDNVNFKCGGGNNIVGLFAYVLCCRFCLCLSVSIFSFYLVC